MLELLLQKQEIERAENTKKRQVGKVRNNYVEDLQHLVEAVKEEFIALFFPARGVCLFSLGDTFLGLAA